MGSETSEINCSYGARRLWDTKVAKISVRRYLPRPHPTSQIPLSSITGLYSSIKTASQSILFGSVRRPLTFAAFVGYKPPAAALITPPPLFVCIHHYRPTEFESGRCLPYVGAKSGHAPSRVCSKGSPHPEKYRRLSPLVHSRPTGLVERPDSTVHT